MALRGNLRDFSLPDVFQLVTFSKKTGVLRIAREDEAQGSVWFRDGDVFFAASNWHTEPLGERLVKAQRLTPQALAKALDIRAGEGEGGRRLGQILIDEGYITDKVLETFVQDQIQDTIFDLMRWDEGEFDFEAMPDAVEEDIGLAVSIENVVMEGSRRLEEWNRIKKKIPSTDVVFKMATAPGEGSFEISLKPVEWNLLQLTDGTRSVAELAEETGRTDFEVARILYGLFSAGLLEFAADAEVERLRAERAERESVMMAAKAQRAAADAASSAAALAREEALEQAAEERRTQPPAAPEPDARPIEEPEFLGGASVAPTAEDLSVFEQMMGAVLESPGVSAVPETTAETPAAPVRTGPEPELPFVSQPQGDAAPFELDLSGLLETPEAAVTEPTKTTVAAELEPPTGAVLEPSPEIQLLAEPASEMPVAEPASETVIEEQARAAEVVGLPELELPERPAASDTDLAALLSYDNLQSLELTEVQPVTPAVTGDFEKDLTALGLGELPPELMQVPSLEDLQPIPSLDELQPVPSLEDLQPIPVVEEVSAASEGESVTAIPALADFEETSVLADLEPVEQFDLSELQILPTQEIESAEAEFEQMSDIESAPEIDLDELAAQLGIETPLEITPAPAPGEVEAPVEPAPIIDTPTEAPDFADLMQSLDDMELPAVETSSTPAEEAPGFDADLLAELAADEPVRPVEAAEQPTGVISTDAFLEDISADMLGSSLGDELSALTGADRPKSGRPTASVNKIPEPGSGVLHRDDRVDKDTVMKIIDGIKNL